MGKDWAKIFGITDFRAAHYYRAPTYENNYSDASVLLTGPEQSHLDDAELTVEAKAEAFELGLIGEEPHQVTEEEFDAGLVISTWTP